MASATQARTQHASQGFAQTPKRSTLGPKLVAGLGACVMLAAVVAITTSDESSSSAAASSPPAPIVAQNVSMPPQTVASPAPPAAIAAPLQAFVAAPPLPPPPVAQVPPQRSTQCDLAQRKFYVAGNGIVRIHAGAYVSAPVTLGPYPQTVAFPASRPAPGTETIEAIVVEGSASTVVMTSDLPGFRKVITGLRGESSFNASWKSLGNC
jgi:hypothetical protein